MIYLRSEKSQGYLVKPNSGQIQIYEQYGNGSCRYMHSLQETANMLTAKGIARNPFSLDGVNPNSLINLDNSMLMRHIIIGKDSDVYNNSVNHAYDFRLKQEKSKWRKRSLNEIVVNDYRTAAIKAVEIPKPVGEPTRRRLLVYKDPNSEPFATRCGNRTSPTIRHVFGPEAHARFTNGELWYRAYYDEFHDLKPFQPTFSRQIAEDLVARLTPFKVDPGPVTTVMDRQNSKDWDVAAELGELPETIKMVYDACKRAIEMKKGTRRKAKEMATRMMSDNRNSVQIADATASLWMTYRYGLTPIAASVQAALDVLLFADYGIYQTQRAGQKEDIEGDFELSVGSGSFTGTRHGRAWLKSYYHADYLPHQRGMRFDLLPAMWELMPVSFVTDWFLNVGDVLSASTPPDLGRTDVSTYSNKYEIDFELELENSLVVGSITSYEINKIAPAQHIGLTLRPEINLKRQFDALALAWFSFRSRS